MAPNLRTYSRKRPDQKKSVDVVNALFVTNLYLSKTESVKPKGAKNTRGVKRAAGQVDSATDNSRSSDPFEKVLRSKNYNDILYKRTLIDTSATDTSKEPFEKETTLDRPVEESLEIETVHKRQVEDDTLNITRSRDDDNLTTTSVPPNPENQSALDESLKEIEEWSYKPLVFKDVKKPAKRKARLRGGKKGIEKAKVKTDWKLKSIPKVVIDKINVKNTKQESFKATLNVSLDEFEKFCRTISENSLPPIVETDCRSDDDCVHDSRFITKRVLRKRANTTVDNLSSINKKSKITDNSSPNKSNLNDTSIRKNFSVLHGGESNKSLITSTPYIFKEGKRILRNRSVTVNLSSNLSQDLSQCKILRSGRVLDNSIISSNTSLNKSEKVESKSTSLKSEHDVAGGSLKKNTHLSTGEMQTKSYLSRTKSMPCFEDISAIEKPRNVRKTDQASYQNSSDSFQTQPMRDTSRSVYRESKKKSPPKRRPRGSKSFCLDSLKSLQDDNSNSRVPELLSTNTSEKSDVQTEPYFLRSKSSSSQDIFDCSEAPLLCGRPRTKTRDPRKHSCSFSNQRLIRSKSLYLDTANTWQSDYSDAGKNMRQCFVDLTATNIPCEKQTQSYDLHTKSMSYLEDISRTEKSDVASDQDNSLKTLPIRRRPRTTNREYRKSEPLKPRLRRSKSFYIDTSECDYSNMSMVMRSGRVLPKTLITPERLKEIIGINDTNLTDSNIIKDSLSNIEGNSSSAIEKEQRNINSLSSSNNQSSLESSDFVGFENCENEGINSIDNYGFSDVDEKNKAITLKSEHITVRRKPNFEILHNIFVDLQQSLQDSNITNHADQTNLGRTQNCTQSSENPNIFAESLIDYESDENTGQCAISTTTTKQNENTSIPSLNGDKSSQNCMHVSEILNDFSESIFDYETDEDLTSDVSGFAIPTSTTNQTENTSIQSLQNIKIIDVCSLPKATINTPDVSAIEKSFITPPPIQRIYKNVKTGKDWRRSLAYRKKSMLESVCQRVLCSDSILYNEDVSRTLSSGTDQKGCLGKQMSTCRLITETNNCACPKCIHIKLLDQSVCRKSVKVVLDGTSKGETKRISLIETYANVTANGYVPENFVRDAALGKLLEDLSVSQNVTRHHREGDAKKEFFVSARDIVLRRCQQTEVVPFEECYPPSVLKNCHKIGEGVYGEVFLFRNKTGSTSVMKVIPIEGDLIVNGERQKKYEEILSEIVIAMELSNLRSNKKNNTAGFSEVRNVHCVQGKYPEQLLDLWNLYDEDRGSENECPDIFDEKQLYIILELANGGKDLESFVFANAKQAYSLFKQAACSLAVAEVELQFEHRDLHWGNILISPIDKNKDETFVINGREIRVPSNGVQISIIDFTLSRINFDGVCIYNDLSLDPDLFNADGDYQFEIYRLMQKRNGNNWQPFEPYTNILWLHYTLDKMIDALRYKPRLAKCHPVYIDKMKELKEQILEYKSVEEFVTHTFV